MSGDLDFSSFFDARGVVDLDTEHEEAVVSAVCDPEDVVEVLDVGRSGSRHTRVVVEQPETAGPNAGEPLFYAVLVDDGTGDEDDDEGLDAVHLLQVEFHPGAKPEDAIDVAGAMDGDLLSILIDRLTWRMEQADGDDAAALAGALAHLEGAATTLCIGRG